VGAAVGAVGTVAAEVDMVRGDESYRLATSANHCLNLTVFCNSLTLTFYNWG
jgi:hypothetical protein